MRHQRLDDLTDRDARVQVVDALRPPRDPHPLLKLKPPAPRLEGRCTVAHFKRLGVRLQQRREYLKEVCWLSARHGHCFASQPYLAEKFGVPVSTVRNWQNWAAKRGYLTVVRTGRENLLFPNWAALQFQALASEVGDQTEQSWRSPSLDAEGEAQAETTADAPPRSRPVSAPPAAPAAAAVSVEPDRVETQADEPDAELVGLREEIAAHAAPANAPHAPRNAAAAPVAATPRPKPATAPERVATPRVEVPATEPTSEGRKAAARAELPALLDAAVARHGAAHRKDFLDVLNTWPARKDPCATAQALTHLADTEPEAIYGTPGGYFRTMHRLACEGRLTPRKGKSEGETALRKLLAARDEAQGRGDFQAAAKLQSECVALAAKLRRAGNAYRPAPGPKRAPPAAAPHVERAPQSPAGQRIAQACAARVATPCRNPPTSEPWPKSTIQRST